MVLIFIGRGPPISNIAGPIIPGGASRVGPVFAIDQDKHRQKTDWA
jgi:hypothetical protein